MLDTNRIAISQEIEDIYSFAPLRANYFAYNVNTIFTSKVTGIEDLRTLRLLYPIIISVVFVFALLILYKEISSLNFAIIGVLIYLSIYTILSNHLTYDPEQAATLTFIFLMFCVVSDHSVDRRYTLLGIVFAIFLPLTYYFQPLLISGILVFLFVGEYIFSSRYDFWNKSSGIGLYLPVMILSLFSLLLFIPRFIPSLVAVFVDPTLGNQGIGSLFSLASEQSVRKISRSGPTTILNYIPRITLLAFSMLATISAVKLYSEDETVRILSIWAGATAVFIFPAIYTGSGFGQTTTLIYLPIIGLCILSIERYTMLFTTKHRLASTIIISAISLILLGNILFGLSPSMIDPTTNIMNDGYHEVEPIGEEYYTVGGWVKSNHPDEQICTPGRLKSAVFYYGRQSISPCPLSTIDSDTLSGKRILYDSQRVYKPPIRNNKIYDNGRLVLTTPPS
jgi:hypothetical protein